MSRQRSYLFGEGRRLRNDKPIFQASDIEIESDLKKMKYFKPTEPPPAEIIPVEIPKKRKAPVNDDKYVIDGLVKLMNIKDPELQKKPQPPAEKKNETIAKHFSPNQAFASFLAFQSHLYRNSFLMQPYTNYLNPQIPIQISSNADKHVIAARFINSHKAMIKNNL